MISHHNILMNFNKISYLTEESKLQEEGMLNTLELDSKVKNHSNAKMVGDWKSEGVVPSHAEQLIIYFWIQKASSRKE